MSSIQTLIDRVRRDHPGAIAELHPLADGAVRIVVRQPGRPNIMEGTGETFEQAAAALTRAPAPEPEFPGVPEHLQTLVPYLLDHLVGGPRSARWLGWAHSGLQVVQAAGLIELDSEHRDGDELYARLAGDTRPFRSDPSLTADQRR